jgi:hypothetical protein
MFQSVPAAECILFLVSDYAWSSQHQLELALDADEQMLYDVFSQPCFKGSLLIRWNFLLHLHKPYLCKGLPSRAGSQIKIS